jgi:hypothetical protein
VNGSAFDPLLLDHQGPVAGSDTAIGLVLVDLEQDAVAGPQLAVPPVDPRLTRITAIIRPIFKESVDRGPDCRGSPPRPQSDSRREVKGRVQDVLTAAARAAGGRVEVPPLAASELEAAVEAFGRGDPQATACPAGAALDMTEIVLERPDRAAEHHPQLFEAARTLLNQMGDLLTPRELPHLEDESLH